jgi:membrane protein DedA with SNARE-associated domain
MLIDFFSKLVEAILLIIKDLGYYGIFIGMAIESSIIPLPSEIILIPAGALVAKGEMNFFLVFIAGVFGSLIGSWISYLIALILGRKSFDFLVGKYGKFFFIGKTHLKATENYFKKHGEITIFVSRLLPVARHLISLPAGFSKMNFLKFSFYTALGAGIYTFFLIMIGYFFGSNAPPVLKILTGIFLAVCIIIIAVYYLKNRNNSNSK